MTRYNDSGIDTRNLGGLLHYHGDSVRILFLMAAILLFVAESTGASLPLTAATTISFAIVLVVLAGITNPAQVWIHWINVVVSVLGVYRFGITAIGGFQSGINVFNSSFIYVELLAILFLFALYLATRTLRAYYQRTYTI